MIRRLAALAVIDITVLAWGGMAGVWPGWILAVHAVLSGWAFAIWLRDTTPLGFAPAILGVVGPAALLVALAIGRVSGSLAERSDDDVFGDPVRRISPRRTGLAVARMLDGRVHHAGPERLSSLVTVMRHGDVPARRRALETVVRSFEPALSPLIALALTDTDQTIRALAAAASARVAENLALARAKPMAQGAGEPDAAATLAALLADHARADVLLSDSQRGHLRDDAVALTPHDSAPRGAILLEALWAAGDYAAIDALAIDASDGVAGWWRAESAA